MGLKTVGTYIFAGLFSEGVRTGGHQIVAHLEDGDFGVETSKLNFPKLPHFTVRERWPRAQLRDLDIDLIFGNPPCAGFSMASRNRGADNPLNNHLGHANALGWMVQPKAFAVESVTQMFLTGDDIVKTWEHKWHELGYNTCRLWENSGHLGLPQERKRALFIAAKANLDFYYPREREAISVRDAIGDLVNVKAVEKTRVEPDPVPYVDFAFTPFQAMARMGSTEVTYHCYQKMNRGLGSLLPHLEPGKRVRSIPDEIYERTYWNPEVGAERHRGGKPSFLVSRLDWDKPSSVITGGITYVHPELDRFLTIRESARLMGLPDRFTFSHPSHAYAEIGKAVSPTVGLWLASQIEEILQDPRGRDHKDEVKLL
jgi:DNA (cytosine-5)-methyltransferase 1